ncbi:hypothetical protein B484DRAFT_453852 [Ochromonadaceae sp. CCMP2298]|nr:hypothetical protein B484DRAFT_453852 [Ochromonadaceae sp. CCMP2298]
MVDFITVYSYALIGYLVVAVLFVLYACFFSAVQGFIVATSLIVLGWPCALVLLRCILLRKGYLGWLQVLGEEARQACRRRKIF